MTAIKQRILDRLKETPKAIYRLSYDLEKHPKTIESYIDDNHIMLTTPAAIKGISEELGVSVKEILTEA